MKKAMMNMAMAGLTVITLTSFSHAGGGENGSSLNGLAKQGLGRELDDYLRRLPMDAPFGQYPATTRKEVVRRELADTAFVRSEQGREALKYLVECALPDTVELHAVHEGVEYKFRGSMNLAPHWLDEKPGESEERWVSACMLARTNYFGKKVMISMRSTAEPTPEALVASPEESAATIHEGDFFGNIFAPQPVAYVCSGRRTTGQSQDDILKARICAEVNGNITGTPFPMTWCGFIYTGYCDEPGSHTAGGVDYAENVSVWLRPLGPRK